MDTEETYRALREVVRDLRVKDSATLTRSALDQGLDPVNILSEGLLKGVELMCFRYEEHEATMADVLLACRAVYMGLEVLLPEIPSETFQKARALKASIVEETGDHVGAGIVSTMAFSGMPGESHL